MRKIILTISSIALAILLIGFYINLNQRGIEYKGGNLFHKKIDSITKEQSVSRRYFFSNCITKITLMRDNSRISSLHSTCASDMNIKEVANAFDSILYNYKNISNKLKNTNELALFLDGEYTRLEYLTRYLNNSNTWVTTNLELLLKTNNNKFRKQHRKMVYDEILKSNIYNPIIKVMEKYNCEMKLKPYDSIFSEYSARHMKKDRLIESGLFNKKSAKKEIYHGMEWLVFDLKCN